MEDEFITKFLNVKEEDEDVQDEDSVKNEMKKKLKEVLNMIDKQRSKVGDIIRAIDEGKDTEERASKITSICLIHSAVTKKDEVSGEWMYCKIDEIKKCATKTEYELIPGMLKNIMHPTLSFHTAQDLANIQMSHEEERKDIYVDPMDEVNRKLKEKAEELEKEGIVLKEGKRSKLGFPE